MSGMRDMLLVARREASERARSRAFLVSTGITMLLVVAAIVVSQIVVSGDESYRVAIAGDRSPALVAALGNAASVRGATVETMSVAGIDEARMAVTDGDADGAVVGADTVIVRARGSTIEGILAEALTRVRLVERLEGAGLTESVILEAASIDIEATEPAADEANEELGLIVVVLLFMVITIYGQWVLLGVLEEKSNRIVELLLSSTTVRSLLGGKIVGIGILGLVQMAVLLAMGLGAAGAIDTIDLPAASYTTAAWSVVWFVLGFGFYAALFAAAGALVSRTEDVQSASMPVLFTLLIGYFVSLSLIVPQPDATISRVLSLLPPIAPIAYPGRLGQGVPLWELLAGAALTVAGIVAVVRVAARVYAGGILLSGGKIKLRRAWKAAGELAGR